MMQALYDVLNRHQLTLSTCESLTGGMFASEFVSISGASSVFLGGIVAYDDKIKESLVGVSSEIIEEHTAISSACAEAMAIESAIRFNSDCCISFTGNAGPEPSAGKPVGLVFIGLYFKGEVIALERHYYQQTRQQVREHVVEDGWQLLLEYIESKIH